jgi:hypothetical protein
MNKNLNFGIIVCIFVLLSTLVAAEGTMLQNTKVDYVQYRELVSGEAGTVYKIKIMNLGDKVKTYEFVPDTGVTRAIGSYRIDPSYKISLKPDEETTVYFYLAIEKQVGNRLVIPLDIISRNEKMTLNLVARPIGSFDAPKANSAQLFVSVFRIVFSTLIILIIILGIILLFRRMKKKDDGKKKENDKPDSEDEIQTYY